MPLPEITAICRVLARSDAKDQPEQVRNLTRLQELRDYLEPHAHPALAACIDSACGVVGYLASEKEVGSQELLEIACRLMAAVDKHWEGPDPDAVLAGAVLGTAAAPVDEFQRQLEDLKGIPQITEMVLGDLLVELGHVSPEDLRECLDQQSHSGQLLGQILVEGDYVSAEVVEETARLQRQLRSGNHVDSAEETAAPAPSPASALPAALSSDAKPNLELDLAGGSAGRAPGPAATRALLEDTLLGQILLTKGQIRREDLNDALEVQRATGMRIGEALVDIGAADWDTIGDAVELQNRLRTAAGSRVRLP